MVTPCLVGGAVFKVTMTSRCKPCSLESPTTTRPPCTNLRAAAAAAAAAKLTRLSPVPTPGPDLGFPASHAVAHTHSLGCGLCSPKAPAGPGAGVGGEDGGTPPCFQKSSVAGTDGSRETPRPSPAPSHAAETPS